ncbi:hypothetical protein ACFO5R_04845 [Halosolutus amylolyticus]|uniref:Uncharacterized protein n=1 Tax=Halosolutus amylolyticus TaxID=2932267 RepID=A0ABD5PL12_9EURY|nr:hypothetical protein [Halosolutus amylolyticus]
MGAPDRDRSRVEDNRMAATIVVGSVLVVVGLAILYRYGWLDSLVPPGGPAIEAVPLIGFLIAVVVALAIWGWGRFLSLFE